MELIIETFLLLLGIGVLGTGLQHRRADGPQDGAVGIAIGSGLLAAFGLMLFFSVLLLGREDEPSSNADDPLQSDGTTYLISGADQYLRSIDQFHFKGTVADGTRFDVTYANDDAVGALWLDGAKLRFMRVEGDLFIKPSDTYWELTSPDPAHVKDVVDGRWIRLKLPDARWAPLESIADRDLVRETLGVGITYERGATEKIHGVSCIDLEADPGPEILCISEAPIRLVRMDDGDGTVGEVDYDAPEVTLKAPGSYVESDDVLASAPTT